MICFSLSSDLSLLGECQINGSTFPDRDSERCPAKTFRLQVGEPKQKTTGRRR
jgi:hypothetical protein